MSTEPYKQLIITCLANFRWLLTKARGQASLLPKSHRRIIKQIYNRLKMFVSKQCHLVCHKVPVLQRPVQLQQQKYNDNMTLSFDATSASLHCHYDWALTNNQLLCSGGASALKGTRSFRGQKILQPGHPGAVFSSIKDDDLF